MVNFLLGIVSVIALEFILVILICFGGMNDD